MNRGSLWTVNNSQQEVEITEKHRGRVQPQSQVAGGGVSQRSTEEDYNQKVRKRKEVCHREAQRTSTTQNQVAGGGVSQRSTEDELGFVRVSKLHRAQKATAKKRNRACSFAVLATNTRTPRSNFCCVMPSHSRFGYKFPEGSTEALNRGTFEM